MGASAKLIQASVDDAIREKRCRAGNRARVEQVNADSQEVDVPLSEHEQRLLQQMEEALSEQDPKFVSQMQRASVRSAARVRITVGAVGVLVGLGLVLVGVTTTMWLGATGFGLMVASVAFAVAAPRREVAQGATARSGDR